MEGLFPEPFESRVYRPSNMDWMNRILNYPLNLEEIHKVQRRFSTEPNYL
jgi:hypothetical protein